MTGLLESFCFLCFVLGSGWKSSDIYCDSWLSGDTQSKVKYVFESGMLGPLEFGMPRQLLSFWQSAIFICRQIRPSNLKVQPSTQIRRCAKQTHKNSPNLEVQDVHATGFCVPYIGATFFLLSQLLMKTEVLVR